MKTNTWLAIGFTAVLVACAPTESAAIKAAKQQIEKDLVDPQSVQYKNIVESLPGHVCIDFNAKNRMGGYIGFERVYINIPDGTTIRQLSDAESSGLCKKRNV